MRLLKRRATHTEPERTVAPAETMVLSPTAAPRIAWADPSWLAWQTLTYSGSAQIKTAGVKHHEADLRALVGRIRGRSDLDEDAAMRLVNEELKAVRAERGPRAA